MYEFESLAVELQNGTCYKSVYPRVPLRGIYRGSFGFRVYWILISLKYSTSAFFHMVGVGGKTVGSNQSPANPLHSKLLNPKA